MTGLINLRLADKVEIRTIVENSVDLLLAGYENIKRTMFGTLSFDQALPIAEHGFSALIDIFQGETTRIEEAKKIIRRILVMTLK